MIGIVGTIIIFGGLIWIARPEPGERLDGVNASVNSAIGSDSLAGGEEALTVAEANNYDFGTISMAAGEVTHQFKIKNTSSNAVTINKMYTSCMCTTATLMMNNKQFGPYGMPGHGATPKIGQTVDPDEEVNIEVVFDPAAHGPAGVGRIQRTVTIENNIGQPIELQFAAVVTP